MTTLLTRVSLNAHLLATWLCIINLTLFSNTALAQGPGVTIDDFEDGDASDWIFFGGNAAGGGGGPLNDRPQEGSFYLNTGWGGQGTNSGFYGGLFRNFDNGAQIVPPPDPWLNVWVLNQSDATAEQYQLEITLREDTNGDGWTDGAEDSIRLDRTFYSSEFDDQWILISAPLSSFNSLATGGNDDFDGKLDEVVIVISGVQGADPSTVEVDFDSISFTSGGPASIIVFDDMEHGDPFGNGWFTFDGAGGGGIVADDTDLPPNNGGAFSLQTGWGSGGIPGFYGGFGRTNPLDAGGSDHFNFWINPDADQEYTLEINLQDDDNADNAANVTDDDEFQFNCEVSASGPCAVSGGGWQLVSIPLADFFDDNSFFTGGNGVLDTVSVANGGNGQLINVVYAVIGGGSDVTFRTDYWAFSQGPLAATSDSQLIDDFESGLPSGFDGDSNIIGFFPFRGPGSLVSISTTNTPPASLPGSELGNNVLQLDLDVAAFAGLIHSFENADVDTWVPQDWSAFEGFSVWIYGQGTGTELFLDVLDNRNPGSTSDDAERFSVSFVDDFTGWQLFEFPFSSFVRKEIGNGAPNDGFTLTEVHGWALGTLNTGGEVTYFVDDAALYGTAEIPALTVNFSEGGFEIDEGDTGIITVKLNRPMNSDDPAQVSVDYFSEQSNAIAQRDYLPVMGSLIFINGGPNELQFQLVTLDNGKWEGNKVVPLKLANPVDVETGSDRQASAYIIEKQMFDPNLQDDFESPPYLWDAAPGTTLSSLQVLASSPYARPGQENIEGVLQVNSPQVVELHHPKKLCNKGNGVVPVSILTTDSFDALSVDHTTVTLGSASEAHVNKKTGLARRHVSDVDNDGDKDLVLHFRFKDTGLDCNTSPLPLMGYTFDGQPISADSEGAMFVRDFPIGQDWSHGEGLSFWYYGTGSGAPITVLLKDNRAPDPGPSGWNLVWSDEFDEPAGTLPKPENWAYEIGDGSRNGLTGWGNEELQYYTDDPANAATDGNGNLVITLREADGSLDCYYGPCEYTSARLISKQRAEFAYGRIEARVLVPEGQGLWPAFWSLGTDIDQVGWPQTGEIDIMEFVGRVPNEIFGTIQGPGYSGGNSYGNSYNFGEPVFNNYHTFTIEWEPNLIKWYVDGILYHTAVPADVAPNEWVFNDAVFLLMNLAIGGNFGGEVGDDIQLPQSMAVDYIRVYQGDDTAERFEVSFTDDVAGWTQVEIPFSEFSRSAEQPAGAPDDGLTLTEVWGYGFKLAQGGNALVDQVQVSVAPPPAELVVTNLNDSGPGSLREALVTIATDGTITIAPGLSGGTLSLTSGELVIERNVTVDASGSADVVISGGGASRVLLVNAGVAASFNDLTIADGAGAPLGGGILNFGTLILDRVTVRDNVETSAGPANFDQGGGGIYNGDGAVLNLVDSTVMNNMTLNQPGGGIYGFFNSSINITRSTISDNVGGDVAGGLRTLGTLTVTNSTIHNNVSSVWHGGAAFITDGTATITNSTITGNSAPGGTTGGLMVATFGAPVDVTITNSIVADNGDFDCLVFGGPDAILISGGYNVFRDGSCNPVASDQIVADPGVGPLVENGGPTKTQALLPGSPAIDSADNGACPATDQRGEIRPQGAACDAGAFEYQP